MSIRIAFGRMLAAAPRSFGTAHLRIVATDLANLPRLAPIDHERAGCPVMSVHQASAMRAEMPHIMDLLEDPWKQRAGCALSSPLLAEETPSGIIDLTGATVPAALSGCGGERSWPTGAPSLELPPARENIEEVQAVGKKGKRTYQPNTLRRKRTHGFLKCAAATTKPRALAR